MSARSLELPNNYAVLLDALRERIRRAQVRAALPMIGAIAKGLHALEKGDTRALPAIGPSA